MIPLMIFHQCHFIHLIHHKRCTLHDPLDLLSTCFFRTISFNIFSPFFFFFYHLPKKIATGCLHSHKSTQNKRIVCNALKCNILILTAIQSTFFMVIFTWWWPTDASWAAITAPSEVATPVAETEAKELSLPGGPCGCSQMTHDKHRFSKYLVYFTPSMLFSSICLDVCDISQLLESVGVFHHYISE